MNMKLISIMLAFGFAILFVPFAEACHLTEASIEATCEYYEITLSGNAYTSCDEGTYLLKLVPILSEEDPIEVSGSFTMPCNGNFYDLKISGYWGEVPCGSYSIEGTISLIKEYTDPQSLDTMDLGPITLDCPCDEGDEGCTPGYWKNHLDAWPENYESDNLFSSRFGQIITIKWSEKGKPEDVEDPTLLQALEAKGGGESRLARHGTAALLSAAHLDVAYPLTFTEIKTAVQDGDLDKLEEANELGCPLN